MSILKCDVWKMCFKNTLCVALRGGIHARVHQKQGVALKPMVHGFFLNNWCFKSTPLWPSISSMFDTRCALVVKIHI